MEQVVARPPGLGSFPFFVHKSGDIFISTRIRKTGVWEPFESRLLLALLKCGDQVIDVGANIGWYTVSAARRVTAAGHVFAFEPDATNFALLSANVREGRLSWVSQEEVALGRVNGTATLRRSSDNLGDHRIHTFRPGPLREGSSEAVQVLALDSYLAEAALFDVNRLRIVKIDVQGFENEVLGGAHQLLSHLPRRTLCFIEFDPVLLRACAPDACANLIHKLCALDREMYALSRPVWRLIKLTRGDLEDAAKPEANRSFDLIVAHAESLNELRRALPIIPRLLSCAALPAAPFQRRRARRF
jgi:FkbM family methyltransferase